MLIPHCSEGPGRWQKEYLAREQSCLDLPLSRQQMISQLAWRKEVWLLGALGCISQESRGFWEH